jgi:RNA polymerase sigma-70 factor, ECF subfamily
MDAVHRLTFAILGDQADAADAAQEAFVAAWRQIGRLRDVDRFEPWLQRVTINAARMVHRARRRRSVREIAALRPELAPQVVEQAADADARVLDRAMARLDVDQRSILVLHHLDGRSVIDLAAILDIPVGTVKSRLFAARRALQAAIDAEVQDR